MTLSFLRTVSSKAMADVSCRMAWSTWRRQERAGRKRMGQRRCWYRCATRAAVALVGQPVSRYILPVLSTPPSTTLPKQSLNGVARESDVKPIVRWYGRKRARISCVFFWFSGCELGQEAMVLVGGFWQCCVANELAQTRSMTAQRCRWRGSAHWRENACKCSFLWLKGPLDVGFFRLLCYLLFVAQMNAYIYPRG